MITVHVILPRHWQLDFFSFKPHLYYLFIYFILFFILFSIYLLFSIIDSSTCASFTHRVAHSSSHLVGTHMSPNIGFNYFSSDPFFFFSLPVSCRSSYRGQLSRHPSVIDRYGQWEWFTRQRILLLNISQTNPEHQDVRCNTRSRARPGIHWSSPWPSPWARVADRRFHWKIGGAPVHRQHHQHGGTTAAATKPALTIQDDA